MFETEFVAFPTPRYTGCHCSTVVELPDGDLLCAWYAGLDEAKPDVQVVSARKPAGSRAWTEPVTAVDDDPAKPMGNCVLWVDGRGRVWLFYNVIHGRLDGPPGPGVRWDTCDSRYRISEDGGRTWGPMQMLRAEWGCVYRTKPLVHSSGAVVLGVGGRGAVFFVTKDGGQTWALTGPVPSDRAVHHPTLIERHDGSILAFLRPRQGTIACSVSKDVGQTWSPAEDTGLPNPGAAVDMVKLADGRVALAFNNTPHGRSPLTIALSEDEGQTWPIKRDIETAYGEFSYPAIIQGRDGLIHLTYTWRRTHIKHAAFDPAWVKGK